MVLKVQDVGEQGKYFKCKKPEGASFDGKEEVKLTLGKKYEVLEHYRDDKDGSIVAYGIIDDSGIPVLVKDGHFNFYDHDSDGTETASIDFHAFPELIRRALSSGLGYLFGCAVLGSLLNLFQIMSLISDTQTTTLSKILNISLSVSTVVLLPTIAIFCYKRGIIPSKAIFLYKVSFPEKKGPATYFFRQFASSMIAFPLSLGIIPPVMFIGFFNILGMGLGRSEQDKDFLSKLLRLAKQLGRPLINSGQTSLKRVDAFFKTEVVFCSYKETLGELKRAA